MVLSCPSMKMMKNMQKIFDYLYPYIEYARKFLPNEDNSYQYDSLRDYKSRIAHGA